MPRYRAHKLLRPLRDSESFLYWRESSFLSPGVERDSMSGTIQSGTILVDTSALQRSLGETGEIYSDHWLYLGTKEGVNLHQRLRAAGWNLFFMAEELRTLVTVWGGEKSMRSGIKRLLARASAQRYNCVQLSNVRREHFLGIPYLSVVAHARHLQKGSQIDSFEQRNPMNQAAAGRR